MKPRNKDFSPMLWKRISDALSNNSNLTQGQLAIRFRCEISVAERLKKEWQKQNLCTLKK